MSSDHEPLHLAGALIDSRNPYISIEFGDFVVVAKSVATMDLQRVVASIVRRFRGEQFGLSSESTGIAGRLRHGCSSCQQASGFESGRHIGDQEPDRLMLCNRNPELNPLLCVIYRQLQSSLMDSYRLGSDSKTRVIERREGYLPPLSQIPQ